MKVLLTGSSGYIGVVLANRLLEGGHEVVGLDTDLFADCTFEGRVPETPRIDQDTRDLSDTAFLNHELASFDAVIHLAGLSNDPLGDYRPDLTFDINYRASLNLARMAKAAGVKRFLFASSCSNYGAAGDGFLTEASSFNPVTPYGRSKVLVEETVSLLADDSFSPTFLRAATAYGMSPRIRFDLVVNNLTAWAFTTGEVRLKSDGSPWRPLVHVDDLALAYAVALEAPRDQVHNRAFNVGATSENYQIRDIAAMVEAVVPNSRVSLAEDHHSDIRNYRVDCNMIARELRNFKPQWTCRRGIEQLYDAFFLTKLSVEDFEGERYKRIAHIQKLIRVGEIDEDLRPRRGPTKVATLVSVGGVR